MMSLRELTNDWAEEGFRKFCKWERRKRQVTPCKNATKFGRIVSVLLIIGFYSSSGLAVRNLVIEGYREAQWGMSPDEIKGAFPNKPFAELEHPWNFSLFGISRSEEQKITYYFWYQDEILDSEVPVSFFFFENQLYKVEVAGGGLSSFGLGLTKTLLRLLMEKYGPPTYGNEADFQWRWDDGGNHLITLTKYGIEYLDIGTRNRITQLIQKKEKQTEKEALEKL